jgi:hypothetical protein
MATETNAALIINALKANANETLSAALGATPLEAFNIGSNGNFPYSYTDTRDVTLFNKLTYEWISKNLKALKADADPRELDASFTNLYIKAITSISWGLSTADQAALNKASVGATQQAAAVQQAWIAAFGALPAGTSPIDDIAGKIATDWANPATTLPDIQNAIDLDQLLHKKPAAGASVLPVFVNWLNAMSSVLSLQNSVSVNNAYLGRAKRAAQTPTADNGGLKLNDNTIVPAYAVSTAWNDILNPLKSGKPEVTLHMDVKRTTSNEFSVTVKGSAGVTIPILDLITIGVKGNASYFSSDLATTENMTTVDMTFPGVVLVNFGPVDFQESGASKYWFWMDPIREAIRNGDKDVSGYKFSPNPHIDFTTSGPFGYLMGVAMSSYPTMTITVKSANYHKIQQTFEQTVSLDVSFLGIKLASGSESTYSNKVSVDASNQTVTITLSPPPELVAGTQNEARGWILGVQTNYPAA